MDFYSYILNFHCPTSGEESYIVYSKWFLFLNYYVFVFLVCAFVSCQLLLPILHAKTSTSENIDSLLFLFSPQHCKKVPVIYAWFCFLCSHTYIFEIWLLRNQLLKCSHTRTEIIYVLFLTSSGSKRKNVIVLRRAKTRIYFLRERVSFGTY